ncbi:unnamed protein product [Ambrosiozyma monospora]|uniref:Unnamed protein product n=1 Tax=Ambrosiozyma monospora TaxID=43982 RepID=A0ACB5T6R8_AMBMO|nr:unnamed protein product [Ambrosiozyma monospora]
MDVDILDPDLFQSASSNYNANLDASHESYGSELPCYSSVDCLKKNACGYGGYGSGDEKNGIRDFFDCVPDDEEDEDGVLPAYSEKMG